MNRNLQETAELYEQRFNCVVCLCPHLRMVTGTCQHRVCITCLYGDGVYLRENFLKCPVCQYHCSFPCLRPEIPEDSIYMMQCLGVRVCPNSGCGLELWLWEMEEHLRSCASRPASPKKKNKTRKRSKSRSARSKDTGEKVLEPKGRRYNFRSKSVAE